MQHKELKRILDKFNWTLFCSIYFTLTLIAIVCFLVGMGCDEYPNPGLYCWVIMILQAFACGAVASVLLTVLDHMEIYAGIFVIFVAVAVHSFVYTILITFIKKKIAGWKIF